jgi:hypothetical protein
VTAVQINLRSFWASFEIDKSKSKLCYYRRSVGQSVLEQSTHLGLTTRSWLLSDSCGFVDLGRSLWREDGSAVCNCYWPSPAQSFSGPSPVGLVAIFYCLRFETSLFVASYDSQGHGGGIRPRLHTGRNRQNALAGKMKSSWMWQEIAHKPRTYYSATYKCLFSLQRQVS